MTISIIDFENYLKVNAKFDLNSVCNTFLPPRVNSAAHRRRLGRWFRTQGSRVLT